MAEINNDEKRITVSGEQIEEVVGKVPTIEADVKANKQNISSLQTASAQHTADIAKNAADIALKANAEDVYTISQTVEAVTETVAEIVANADDDFDTLRELSDWLKNHSGSAAEMNSAIQENTKAIADNAKVIEENTADIGQNETDISRLRNDTFGTPDGRVTSNSNMDTFITPGSWLCLSSAVAKTLINCPVDVGFRIEVKALAAGVDRCIQIIYPNADTDVFCLFRRLTSTGFTNWYKVAGVAVAPITPATAE